VHISETVSLPRRNNYNYRQLHHELVMHAHIVIHDPYTRMQLNSWAEQLCMDYVWCAFFHNRWTFTSRNLQQHACSFHTH